MKVPRCLFTILVLLILFSPKAPARQLRVISLAPNITEILYEIGLSEKEIVGVTDYCDYPSAARNIATVGSLTSINIEKIVSLYPDYVFAAGNMNSPLNRAIKNAGVNIVVMDPQSIEEIFTDIIGVGNIVHKESEAAEAVTRMKKKLAGVSKKVRALKEKKKVYIEIWDDPITTCGRNSFLDEVITMAGGINIAGSIDVLYPNISQEFVIREDPDVIIAGYMSRNQERIKKDISYRFGWQDVSAVKNGRIICDINPSLFLKPGPRIAEGIERIYRGIYEAG